MTGRNGGAANVRVRRRGTDRMTYLEQPVPFRAHGRDCLALVVDPAGRVFARWMDGGRVRLAWVQHGPPAAPSGSQRPTAEDAE